MREKKRQPCNINVSTEYKSARNKVNRELKKSKKEYYLRYFDDNKNNIRNIWKGIRSIINIKNTVSPKITQLSTNGNIIDNPLDVANTFNNFFANVGPTTERSIPKVPNISPESYLKRRLQYNFIVAHISNEEVLEIINNLENKSTGPSSIPIKLLKIIPDLIIIPLCKIINISFCTGVFPDALKVARVAPVHKGGSTLDVNNFRPISLLSIFDKIIEKLMHKRLYSYLEEHNVIFNNQFGFRKGNSTIHSLIQITEEIKSSIENGKHGCGIFIDLRKAFDTVNHQILLSKLEHYGVRCNALNWFRSYLYDRKQYVCINGSSSALKTINCGVPQGSVLGPLLFLIYINDLPGISNILSFFLFADDTNIYYESDNLTELESTVNVELKKLDTWLCVNRLSLNITKTNFVIFHPFNKPLIKTITLKIRNKAISEERYVKYLGVLIDSSLSWKFHIDNLQKKLSRTLGLLYKIRPFVNTDILMTLYYSIFYPHILYAIQVWGFSFECNKKKLVVLQKKIVRLISNNDSVPPRQGAIVHTNPIFTALKILKLNDVFDFQIASFVYDCLHKISPRQFSSWFVPCSDVHSHATRNSTRFDNHTFVSNLFIHQVRTTHYGLKSIKFYGSKLWNNIPDVIRQAKSKNIFKNRLKLHYLTFYDLVD